MNRGIISYRGIGYIFADLERGTLQPRTHVVGQRLHVGYSSDVAERNERARDRRREIQVLATASYGKPADGWQWLDHNGCEVRP